ncbi:hypothetical protein PUNSTDRAFT_139864 [Punctularia strigosozonata HHB-11173 SS5]|uniref:uncharacterized protein n=1 Tax=Punctularia strigosozonata (strain HHB-11173) TaxID=741275 RepID=UPI000441775B|nr:uncharacterized protein PUNSTDRAFT_139864 [Punctularia strigosozonata HHB-11173 SS5]EIN13245.1 hypothetical protein PUNSTDRAFT_139864 [Punctularia strigosozonata HHB-11173 SS5]
MHFGPEWMRPKQAPAHNNSSSRSQHDHSPDPGAGAPSTPGAATYSALVTPAPPVAAEKRNATNPFSYTKEELLAIYKEGGGQGGLGIEVERWEGVVREVGSEPVGLKEMTEAEKKLFLGPLNSELRRRQSTDYLSPLNTPAIGGERPRLVHQASGAISPMREKFSGLMGRRRDSDTLPPTLPRKLSLSSVQSTSRDGALPSPRTRTGFTPGFDGILSTPKEDSWMAKRRAEQGLPKPANGSWRAGDPSDVKGLGIKEEPEEGIPPSNGQIHAEPESYTNGVEPEGEGPANTNTARAHGTGQGLDVQSGVGSDTAQPSVQDLKSVEWSYIDPQGIEQGPFRADIMQKWHDDGYFTPDLRMRRTRIDRDWTTVAELWLRAGDEAPIFLTPIMDVVAPPGLARRNDKVTESPITATPPYQPVPQRTLRGNNLDAFLGDGSTPSDSPASSFGAARFGNGTPELTGFGGRAAGGIYAPGEPLGGSRLSGLGVGTDAGTPFRRNTQADQILGPGFANQAPTRAATLDNYPFSGFQSNNVVGSPALQSPITPGNFGPNQPRLASLGHGLGGQMGPLNGSPTPYNRDAFGNPILDERMDIPGRAVYNNSNYGSVQGSPFDRPQHAMSSPSLARGSPSLHAASPVMSQGLTASPHIGHPQPASTIPTSGMSRGPWDDIDPAGQRRARPFDALQPQVHGSELARSKSRGSSSRDVEARGFEANIAQQEHVSSDTWAQNRNAPATQSIGVPQNASPWVLASKGVVDERWGETPGDPNRLTHRNLMKLAEQQQRDHDPRFGSQRSEKQQEIAMVAESPISAQPEPAVPLTSTAAPASAEPADVSTPTVKPRRKSAVQTQAATVQPAAHTPPVPQAPQAESTATVTAGSKAAPWAVDDKSKTPATAMGLREIQEAEAKRAEAQKRAAEKAVRAVAASPVAPASEEPATFTTSWGLPTSKAGVARAGKDATGTTGSPITPASPAVPVPVWTNAVKAPAAKKTMKEIQEEEEKRKKLAKEKETAAATARRAYAETTTKTVVPSAQATGGAWTTVGAKPATPAAVRPAATPAASSSPAPPTAATRVTANGTSARTVSTPQATKPAPSAPKDDFPLPPSQDFLRWLADTLKGLSSSVNLEEITSMLLSFPLDPDPSTTEIISDLIYANSTTMDGRRFASDFINRRKADATNRSKNGAASGATGKGTSAADVVKAQPKPAQPEWGFKVVNKKKKNARA